jgi:hypothetical protein
MKFLNIFVIGLVSIVCLNRFPSPLRSLKFDLIAKSRLTMLSAVAKGFDDEGKVEEAEEEDTLPAAHDVAKQDRLLAICERLSSIALPD